MITNLTPQYDSRKSFYGKAKIKENDMMRSLYSYDTLIVSIDKTTNKVTFTSAWDASQTTLRHVKEFLYQNNLFVGSKAEIKKHYQLE